MELQVCNFASVQAINPETGAVVRIAPDSTLPAWVSEEQKEEWIASGLVVGAEPEKKTAAVKKVQERVNKRNEKARLARLEKVGLRAPAPGVATETYSEPLEKANTPYVPGTVRHPGIWNFDPATLQGMSLQKLQIKVAEVVAKHGLSDQEMPATEKACIALLSSNFVPGTRPQ